MSVFKKGIREVAVYGSFLLLSAVCIIPFYMMIINATLPNADIAYKINLLPGKFFLKNYESLKIFINIWGYLGNSVLIALPSTVLAAYFGTMAAYGFAKFKFRGNGMLFGLVLATMMIPYQLSLLGFFQMAAKANLVDTYWPIILPSIANAGTVFWMKGYIESVINDSLIEAARLDGYNELAVFNKVILPLSRVGVVTISIFNFVHAWNDYMTPLIFLNTVTKYPISVGIAALKGVEGQDQGVTYAALALSIMPIIIVYLFLNSRITGGITAGGVKG